MNKRYLYSGVFSGVSLKTPTGIKEILLHPNTHVELPSDHEYVKTLVALGHLSEVQARIQDQPEKLNPTTKKAGEK